MSEELLKKLEKELIEWMQYSTDWWDPHDTLEGELSLFLKEFFKNV